MFGHFKEEVVYSRAFGDVDVVDDVFNLWTLLLNYWLHNLAIVIAGWGSGGYVEGASGYQTSPCAVWRESDPSTTTYHPGA